MEDGGTDVFVPASKLATALHGDRVRLRTRESARGREGEVREILERGTRRVVGTLMQRRKRSWIDPEDPRLPRPIHVVGRLPLGVHPGQQVIAAIDRYPIDPREGLQVHVLSGIAPRGSAASEIERIEIREGIEEEFSRAALREAQSFGSRVSEHEIAGRTDLRALEFVTIDPATARDHDDAVYAERLSSGAFRVWVAIADVSYYVRPGTELDRAALSRGTSIYLPDRVIPMLPFELSSHLASLIPDESRLALVLEVELGPRGAVRRWHHHEAVVCSRARLSYSAVASALGFASPEGSEHDPEAEARRPLLETLFDASQVIRKKRQRRGALEFELPEPAVGLDARGEPIDIVPARSDPGLRKAYGMIEDLMLLANEVVASDLAERGLPAIYRVHAPPDPERIERFAELAYSLGFSLSSDADTEPAEIARLLRQFEGLDAAPALNYLLLRAMQQATYSTENIGHFALAAPHYLHFTSPIRRYPDLAVHRIVRDLIARTRVDRAELARSLARQAARSSRLERRAQSIDREVARIYAAVLLASRIGEEFDARITSIDTGGLWVTLEHPFVEAYCAIEHLGPHGYRVDPLGLHMVARRSGHRLSVGQQVKAELLYVSVEERTINVRVEGALASSETDARVTHPRERERSSGSRTRTRGRKPKQRRKPRR